MLVYTSKIKFKLISWLLNIPFSKGIDGWLEFFSHDKRCKGGYEKLSAMLCVVVLRPR